MPLTHAQIENPGDLFANVAKAILLADSPAWPFTPYDQRVLGAMDNSRVMIHATPLGRATDHMQFANVNGNVQPYYDTRRLSLAFEVISPVANRASGDNHAYCVGRIGYLCDRVAQKFTTAALSGLEVIELEEAGTTSPAPEQKTDADHTTRTFNILYGIPPTIYAAAA